MYTYYCKQLSISKSLHRERPRVTCCGRKGEREREKLGLNLITFRKVTNLISRYLLRFEFLQISLSWMWPLVSIYAYECNCASFLTSHQLFQKICERRRKMYIRVICVAKWRINNSEYGKKNVNILWETDGFELPTNNF